MTADPELISSSVALVPIKSVSNLAEARFHRTEVRARCSARVEGGRWQLRRMRAGGCTDLTAMGIESFFVYSLLILLGLGKSEETKNRS
jgi:hypothetical protein